MSKKFKTGILAALLVLPVFVFLFLYTFGNNKFKIPVYFAEDSVLVNGKYVISKAQSIPEFRFRSNLGTFLENKDLSNSVYVADFFFTRCPGICKDMSGQLSRVQESFKEDTTVKIVSFTVDPIYDNVTILDKYAKLHRAIPGKWYFLTGTKDSIYDLAKHGFYLSALEDKNHKEEFIHDNHFVLVDKKGWIRGYYDGTDKKDVDRLITEVKILLKEYDK